MTHDGVKRMMRVMISAYPNYHPSDMASTINVWETILRDYSDEEGALALEAYIRNDVKGFAPAIGQIIEFMQDTSSEIGELEAWGLVRKAIRNGNYGAEREFNKLPEVVRTAIGGAGQIREWAQMDIDSVESVAQSNFLRAYRNAVERERSYKKMSGEVRERIGRRSPVYALEVNDDDNHVIDGVPMPDELRKKLMEA